MLAGLYRALQHRSSRALLAALCLAPVAAAAQDALLPQERMTQIGEVIRVTPHRAIALLEKLDAETAGGPPGQRAQFLVLSCDLRHRLGEHLVSSALCEQAVQLARQARSDDVLARALLSKAYALFSLNEMARSHQLIWEAEKLSSTSRNDTLRVHALISSGEAYAEDGNFLAALSKLQAAVTLARQTGQPLLAVISLKSLAYQYYLMREYDKGFEAIEEALRTAETMEAPGRLAILKTTEYILSVAAGDLPRGVRALQSALALEREIGARAMIANTLINLSDAYLKQRDYRAALSSGQQGLAQARALHDDANAATALVNVGYAYLGLGRMAEGKKYVDEGIAWYEKAGNKPDLQSVLAEYGDALERAGDLPAALTAYHRERALSNELFERRRQKAMMELQEKYEADKRQRQILLLRQENQVKSTELDNRRLQQRIWWLLALVFALVSTIVGLLYRKVRQANAQLEEKNQELKQQSARDPLTALYNRRHFQEFMRGHDGAGDRAEGGMVSAMYLLDVDHFKHINDTYGHGAGDAVLREIAAALREILRETDMIVRWGGEEFLAFLPSVPRDRLDEVARRLLNGIPARTIDYQGVPLSVNVSIGFAPFPLGPGTESVSWERAVNIVDMALYLAKGHGRNRAYGVRGLARLDGAAMDEIEQDIEGAWRAGRIDLAIVHGNPPELRMAS
ncbi:tetratricopeptide repeat-containing diguanylate cyclase [uncultured Massilia sp.]|uniref:tetratricopeptide repeat-containing diguanylate cyclase n=1 Tax=uncultured Massilia sp. TaxID=169973 RepID=UPI0025F776CC|nr:tetratricopeptide repeat-containing diguanylate cyclase [uncultured Massilia sp.]